MTTAPFLSRPLGNFLLIAQLSEDALGTVYRAIYAPDERRFVRLRILQSPDLMPEAVFSAIEKGDDDARALIHRAIVPNAEVGLADGLPYLAWDEVAGWTLDQFLARVRALDVRIPPEYALLVAERIATALEYASRAVPGRPIAHGLVWPGFVSISSNAEIRLGGFGLAEALLNSLHRPRIGREVAPYAAPEARETGEVGPDTDVYSVGVILTELLTGRRPRRSNPAEALETVRPVPEELRALVARSLAPSGERFASIVEMRRALEEILTASPYALYTGNLALFLYRLLNPEGQNVMDAADGDATNPVENVSRAAEVHAEPDPESELLLPPFDAPSPIDAPLPAVVSPYEHERAEPRFHVAMAVLPAPPQLPPKGTVWIGRVGFAVAASLVAAGVFFPGHRGEPGSPAERSVRIAGGAPTAVPSDVLTATLFTGSLAARQASPARDGAAATVSVAHASAPSSRRADRRAAALLARRSAESLRLRAALARIDAERLDAEVIARDLFAEAQGNEKEGNLLLQQGAFEPAQPALMRATQLYRMAEDVSREERVRLVRLSSPQ